MKWKQVGHQPWQEPLEAAREYAGRDMTLLYSSLSEKYSGQFSFLFTEPLQTLSGENWNVLPATEPNESLPQWVGYLGYGLHKNAEHTAPSPITFPNMRFTRYARMWRFDHASRQVEAYIAADAPSDFAISIPPKSPETEGLSFSSLASNFTRNAYETAVAKTIEAIHAGEFYQANLTRKFFGRFAAPPDSWAIFEKLCATSPAPYSAFIRQGRQSILSSSPECFLSMTADGQIITRPIKGSARRSPDPTEDSKIREALRHSEKNHAENLMIVDLMRNDLSRVCEHGSVKVQERSGLHSYATIHHLVSTITGQKKSHATMGDVLRAVFPAGSMTGAPKIAAMRWCSKHEAMERGVYSGAIGWLAGNACDFSVVIRTLLIEDDRFEFQVGGGIVADSTPEDEWRETLIKARGILAALGLDEEAIARL